MSSPLEIFKSLHHLAPSSITASYCYPACSSRAGRRMLWTNKPSPRPASGIQRETKDAGACGDFVQIPDAGRPKHRPVSGVRAKVTGCRIPERGGHLIPRSSAVVNAV